MKKIAVVMLALAMIFLMSASAYAAGAGIGQGTIELSANGTLMHSRVDAGNTTGSLDMFQYLLGGGYFLTDSLQLGLTYLGTIAKASNDTDTKVMLHSVNANLKYFFYEKGQTIIPYVGIQGGFVSVDVKYGDNDYSKTAGSYGALAGLKFFITENVTFNTEFNYLHYQVDIDDTTVKNDNFALFLGFSYYFK